MTSFRRGPFKLDRRYSVGFVFTGSRIEAQWEPDIPRGQRGRRLLPVYQAARDIFIRDLSEEMGLGIVCIDWPPADEGD
jgi:hypothetical protein